jgi:hypothetical protein
VCRHTSLWRHVSRLSVLPSVNGALQSLAEWASLAAAAVSSTAELPSTARDCRRPWGPLSLLADGYKGAVSREWEADYSLPSSAKDTPLPPTPSGRRAQLNRSEMPRVAQRGLSGE